MEKQKGTLRKLITTIGAVAVLSTSATSCDLNGQVIDTNKNTTDLQATNNQQNLPVMNPQGGGRLDGEPPFGSTREWMEWANNTIFERTLHFNCEKSLNDPVLTSVINRVVLIDPLLVRDILFSPGIDLFPQWYQDIFFNNYTRVQIRQAHAEAVRRIKGVEVEISAR